MPTLRFAQIVALCMVTLVASPAAHAQSVARPDLKVGDTWTVGITSTGFGGAGRRDEVRVVKEAGENGYQFENTKKEGGGAAPSVEMLTISRDLNFVGRAGGSGPPQEFRWLQWPLEPGRAIQFEINIQNQITTWKGKVVGWEDIEVPAGKFKALHLEFDRSGPFRGSASESVWYAPEAKTVIKRVQMRPGTQGMRDLTTQELVAYKLN